MVGLLLFSHRAHLDGACDGLEGLVMSGEIGAGDGLSNINSQVFFLMKCKGICTKEGKVMQVMSVPDFLVFRWAGLSATPACWLPEH